MITLRPTGPTQADFFSRIQKVESLARAHPDLVRVVQRAILLGFLDNFIQESSAGMKWAALTPFTLHQRSALGYPPGPILVRSGDYRSSWITEGEASHVHDLTTRQGGWTLDEGSSHEFAEEHELGRANMPARPVRFLSAEAEENLRQAVDRALFQALSLR
jgi:hypothetical protein